jgi:hypothetical protein
MNGAAVAIAISCFPKSYPINRIIQTATGVTELQYMQLLRVDLPFLQAYDVSTADSGPYQGRFLPFGDTERKSHVYNPSHACLSAVWVSPSARGGGLADL